MQVWQQDGTRMLRVACAAMLDARLTCSAVPLASRVTRDPQDVPPIIVTPMYYLISVLRHNMFFLATVTAEVRPRPCTPPRSRPAACVRRPRSQPWAGGGAALWWPMPVGVRPARLTPVAAPVLARSRCLR